MHYSIRTAVVAAIFALTPPAAEIVCFNTPAAAESPAIKPSLLDTRSKYRAVGFSELPGWQHDDHVAAFTTFLRSCNPILYGVRSGSMRSDRLPTPPGLLSACFEAAALRKREKKLSSAKTRDFFEHHFTPHEVATRSQRGLLTGYFEPVVEGARSRFGPYQTPIYGDPGDAVSPLPDRAEIEAGALAGRGLELFFLKDPVDAFFIQIEGSGRIKLPDGSHVRIAYDGKNGHRYTSIARHLIDSGTLPEHKVSRAELKQWLRADPERGARIMKLNKSFVFFREIKAREDKGALGVMKIPLTAGRSLAVDSRHHPIGTPVFVDAPGLRHAERKRSRHFRRLLIAQDIGAAINGPERGDIFFGSGSNAGARASITRHRGRFFVLLPQDGTPPHNAKGWEPVGLTRHARR